jgi:superkiller protein 3
MATKALLRAVNEAIKQQKWDNAIESAGEAINKDAKNYQA